jgi:hypothetical protein
MNTRVVSTAERGQPRYDRRIEDSIALAIAQGRIPKASAGLWRDRLMADYESGIDMLASLPTSGVAGEDRYLDYARATGVLSMIDDPRMQRSWETRR